MSEEYSVRTIRIKDDTWEALKGLRVLPLAEARGLTWEELMTVLLDGVYQFYMEDRMNMKYGDWRKIKENIEKAKDEYLKVEFERIADDEGKICSLEALEIVAKSEGNHPLDAPFIAYKFSDICE